MVKNLSIGYIHLSIINLIVGVKQFGDLYTSVIYFLVHVNNLNRMSEVTVMIVADRHVRVEDFSGLSLGHEQLHRHAIVRANTLL